MWMRLAAVVVLMKMRRGIVMMVIMMAEVSFDGQPPHRSSPHDL
jgi:hypothetical protein